MITRRNKLIGAILAALAGAVLIAATLGSVMLRHDRPGRQTFIDAVAAVGVGSDEGVPTNARDVLAPDLQTLPPEELYVARDSQTDARELRFSTTVINSGDGPLELVGTYDPATDLTRATQLIQSATSDGSDERFVGSFVFHPGHTHWHFENFTEFELWTYSPAGELEELVTTSGKMTFCLMDDEPLDPAPPNAPTRAAFGGCNSRVQGISVGWSDTYPANLIGQELDSAAVPDGRYALRATVDPDNRLLETDDTNNATVAFVQLTGMRVQLLSGA